MSFKELIFLAGYYSRLLPAGGKRPPHVMNFCGPSAEVVKVIMTLRKGTQVSQCATSTPTITL